jgi:hypothetical protein
LQDDEARFRPGTNKYTAFQLLKAAGPAGLSVPQLMQAARDGGVKDWNDNARRILQFVRAPSLSVFLVIVHSRGSRLSASMSGVFQLTILGLASCTG